jgi:hypothetical protein
MINTKILSKNLKNDETQKIRLTKDQAYAINWCYVNIYRQYGYTCTDMVIHGVNITQAIKEVLGKTPE